MLQDHLRHSSVGRGGMVGVVDGERREDALKLISLIASKRSRNS